MTVDAPVVIVGAGPTGMTAALDLAFFGIPSLIVDESVPDEAGSRAIAYHSSTLAVWEKLGAAQAMLKKGIAWSRRHTFFHLKEVYTQSYPPPKSDELPAFLNLQQYYVEQFLLERIKSQPLVDLRWNQKVTALSQAQENVTLEVETSSGLQRFSTAYVLACDGARSTLRNLLGLDFPGRTYDDRFLIADIRANLDLPPEPCFYFNHPAHSGPTVLIHPQPDGIWRIDWQIGSAVDIDYERSPERMDDRIRALIGHVPYEIAWLSDYRFHQRLLERLRHGRVFFLGDAAHLVAPFGARGLNSAVQDVENLSWKLALALHGQAPDALLHTYHTERWAAQTENQRVTINTMKFMAPTTRVGRFRRRLILGLTGFFPFARKWVDSGRMISPYTYTKSPLNIPDLPESDSWKKDYPLGSKLPDRTLVVWQDGLRQEVRQRSLCGRGFLVLYAALDEKTAEEFVRSVRFPPLSIPCEIVPVFAGLAMLQPGGMLLLRPDGHIAARRRHPNPGEISELIVRICQANG